MLEIQSDPRTLRELLIDLVENFKFELSFLSRATGVDINSLEKFYNRQVEIIDLSLSLEQHSKFTRAISSLAMDITMVKDNDRVRGIIEHLTIHGLKLNLQTISVYADVSMEDLESFMKDTDSISYGKRYKLATKSVYLHFLFKEISQADE